VGYLRLAEDTMVKYEADATLNGLYMKGTRRRRPCEAFAKRYEGLSVLIEPSWHALIELEKGEFRYPRVLDYAPRWRWMEDNR
jgi:hypothetical protein